MYCPTFAQTVVFILLLIVVSWFTPQSLSIVISIVALGAMITFVAGWSGIIKCE